MKKIVFSLGLVLALSISSFAQQNNEELTVSPITLAEKYNASAKANLAKGDVKKASQDLAKLSKYESGKVFQIRNKDSKTDEFYYSKEELDAAVAKGNYAKPKEVVLAPKYGFLLQSEVSALANKELDAANTAIEAKNFIVAGDKFMNVYNLVTALGAKDDIYKYQAAITYYNGLDFDKSLVIIKELAKSNFTGISGSQTKNLNRDLYVLALNNLYTAKKYDPILDEALAKYPSDADINNLATSVYQVSGMSDKLVGKIRENIKVSPNEHLNYYNLGVLLLDDDNNIEEAKNLFKKSIELNPKHIESYSNLVLTNLKRDKDIVENMNNNLGTSKKEKAIYSENLLKRKELFKEVIPYLEKMHELDPSNHQVVRNLIEAYKTTENQSKEDFYRDVEKKMIRK